MPRLNIPLLPRVAWAHLVSHVHMMVVPGLLPILPAIMDVGFVEIGLAISVFNIVSVLVQTPLGFAVDRLGARRVLLAGLLLGSLAFVSLGIYFSYAWLLVVMALTGIANGVYHPADYSLLSSGVDNRRMGKAFSIHTFAGYLGSAMTPALMLGIAAVAGVRWAFVAAGLFGLTAVALLLVAAPAPARVPDAQSAKPAPSARTGLLRVFTPTVGMLTLMFVLLSLSTGSLDRFSASALNQGYDIPLGWANAALTAFLFASAFGVLAGGWLADRTRRHGFVAAAAFALAALLMTPVALGLLSQVMLVYVLGAIGFLTGVIAPSRDMLVRAAAEPGSEGKVFGIVSTGFNIGGTAGPVLFGWLLDHREASHIFWLTIVFMVLTVLLTLWQEYAAEQKRVLAASAA